MEYWGVKEVGIDNKANGDPKIVLMTTDIEVTHWSIPLQNSQPNQY